MVTSMLPHPRSMSGGALVMFGQLAELAARHQVTLATFAGADPAEKDAIADLQASGIDVNDVWRAWPSGIDLWRRRWRDAMGWLRGGRPLRALQFRESRMQHLLNELLRERPFDLLQVEDNAMGEYRYRTRIPAVLTEHEVRWFPSLDGQDRPATSRIGQKLSQAEQRRWLPFQQTVWRRFDRIQVFTPRDAGAIRSIAPGLAARVRVNPFGVEIPTEIDHRREEAGSLIFVGGFGHPPNVDAAVWLVNEIMPPMRASYPGVRLTIIGSYPPTAVRALACQDVIVTGRVPAVEPFLERAAVVVAPMRTGGGMRVKVLQAMAFGKAIVTTPLGAEGLAVTCGEPPLAIVENAAGIASAATALLASEPARRALGRRARAFVLEHHRWSAYGQRLEAIYAELRAIDQLHERGRAARSSDGNWRSHR